MPRLHLSSVKVERFKAAFKPEPVPLRPFNLVLGRNGSGKSTLLEALQWVDGTLRHDAGTALGRYFGIAPVVNVRSQQAFFQLGLTWKVEKEGDLAYRVKVVQRRDGVTPLISSESLELQAGRRKRPLITTVSEANVRKDRPGVRLVYPKEPRFTREVSDPDRLALGQAANVGVLNPGLDDRLIIPRSMLSGRTRSSSD
ncbi:AAA family ATPase [Hyalangium versicolor]|uniref:AAA family ATPase n=1 Tax=Hyalangium versicolor TaxID=2861190 RepID=UPI001CCC7ED9|nr:AAA family ATPase [Hyalangium versicolor]